MTKQFANFFFFGIWHFSNWRFSSHQHAAFSFIYPENLSKCFKQINSLKCIIEIKKKFFLSTTGMNVLRKFDFSSHFSRNLSESFEGILNRNCLFKLFLAQHKINFFQ